MRGSWAAWIFGLSVVGCVTEELDGGSAHRVAEVQNRTTLEALEALLDEYTTWGRAPGWQGVVATPGGAHGDSVQVWYDEEALSDLAAPGVGATSFKEAYADAAGAILLGVSAAMLEPDGRWFYAMWASDGELLESGHVPICSSCHEALGADGFLAGG